MSTQDWFPGKDYPDREVWLKIRCTPRTRKLRRPGRVIYRCDPNPRLRKPMYLGINQAKRNLDARGVSRQELVRQRHAYYRRSAA